MIGPIVGGFVSESHLGWRFSFWIMFMVSALNALAYIFITPETVSQVCVVGVYVFLSGGLYV